MEIYAFLNVVCCVGRVQIQIEILSHSDEGPTLETLEVLSIRQLQWYVRPYDTLNSKENLELDQINKRTLFRYFTNYCQRIIL